MSAVVSEIGRGPNTIVINEGDPRCQRVTFEQVDTERLERRAILRNAYRRMFPRTNCLAMKCAGTVRAWMVPGSDQTDHKRWDDGLQPASAVVYDFGKWTD